MNQPSLWESETFLQPYDLMVIGAGLVGLSAALFYRRGHPGARVAVLEKGAVPEGASTRNAGFACVGSIGEHLADLEKGTEGQVKKRIQQRYRGLELLKETLGEKAIGYESCAGYEFFKSQKEFAQTASEISRFNGWMQELTGTKNVYSAGTLQGYPVIKNRLEGALHPGKMMQQLIRKVMKEGVEIRWKCPVIEAGADGEVLLPDGTSLRARKILLAVNGFVRQLLPGMDVRPARGLVLVTNEQEQMPWRGTFHHDRGYIYFRNIGSRLLIGGARNLDAEEEKTDQFGMNKKIKSHLTAFVSDILKLPAGWRVDHEWSGIMGFTPTKTPVVRRIDEKRYVAAGLSGMGIAIGMETGKSAAALLNDK